MTQYTDLYFATVQDKSIRVPAPSEVHKTSLSQMSRNPSDKVPSRV